MASVIVDRLPLSNALLPYCYQAVNCAAVNLGSMRARGHLCRVIGDGEDAETR